MADNQSNNLSRLFQTAGSSKPQQGTGYTNLNRLFEANKQNQLGQKVAGDIGTQIGGVQTQLQQQQKQFAEDSEKNKVGGQKDVEQREAVLGRFNSPSGAGGDVTEEETKAFGRFTGGQYTGPQALKDTSGLRQTAQQLQGQVSNFSPSGTQELLRRSVGGNKYTQGQSRLDSLLMDRSKLTPVARQAQGLGQEITRADLAASGQAELNKNLAQRFGQETQEKLTEGMGGIDTAIQGQLTTAQAQEKDRLDRIQSIQEFAQNKRVKMDSTGNPVTDVYGNIQYDTNIRGDGDQFSQADRLKSLLTEKGAQQAELEQLFGTSNISESERGRASRATDAERLGYVNLLKQDYDPSRGGVTEDLLNKVRTGTVGNSYFENVGDVGQDGFISGGKVQPYLDWLKQTNVGNLYGNSVQPLVDVENERFVKETGLAGKSLLGGSQDTFYSNLAKTLSNSQSAKGLTEGGLATESQRANYEALNKLLGKSTTDSKYRKDDPTKYEAGKFLLNPEQLKGTF
jgi:hypothetical protein